MKEEGIARLSRIMEIIFKKRESAEQLKRELLPLACPGIDVEVIPAETCIAPVLTSIKHVQIFATGGFRLKRTQLDGGEIIYAHAPAPEILGLPQLLQNDPIFYSTLTTEFESLVVSVDCNLFKKALEKNATVAYCSLQCLSAQIFRNYRRIGSLTMSATDNLCLYIYRQWFLYGRDKESIVITERHSDIASEIPCTLRTVCRSLSYMKQKGWITTDKKGNIHVTRESMEKMLTAFHNSELLRQN